MGNTKFNMNKSPKFNSLKEYVFFIFKSISRLKQVGHILPSSKSLVDSISKTAKLKSAKRIVELGSGTGGTSKGILSNMNADAMLCAIELDSVFTDYMSKNIKDRRLTIYTEGAQNLESILLHLYWKEVDVVISGIPFSTLPHDSAEEIIQSIYNHLKPEGLFVAYQLKDRVSQIATPLFGSPNITWEYKNIPPMRIFCWQKK